MKEQPYVNPHTKYIIIEGKSFVLGRSLYKKINGIKHVDKILLEEVNPKKEDDILNFIATKIKTGVTVEKIIKEAIKDKLGTNARKKLLKLLQSNKVKVKEQDGCYGIVVNGKHFQLFD